MRHLTRDVPKPMVRFRGRPMIDHAVSLLHDAGIDRVFANTHHLPEQIEPHLAELGVAYRREAPEILDTGGGLKALLPLLPEGPVVTLNPDAAWRGANPVSQLLSAWRSGMSCLLLVTPLSRTMRMTPGDFALSDGKVTRKGDFVYTGAQIIDPKLVADIGQGVFSLNLAWDRAIAKGAAHAIIHDGDWADIGTPEGLARIEAEAQDV
jgi:MurNAc alpha-1-phosphate uridylyltransferase